MPGASLSAVRTIRTPGAHLFPRCAPAVTGAKGGNGCGGLVANPATSGAPLSAVRTIRTLAAHLFPPHAPLVPRGRTSFRRAHPLLRVRGAATGAGSKQEAPNGPQLFMVKDRKSDEK
ncbi:hypothetical protein AAU01_21910 [Paenarthrobacter aurescens]|uniref:Uncharacterized protein n=1 Tax=Paenarthrobacter aurescens TaxID=43663 RepID=A0A4Y3NJU1_PAEAU|nr:hypothetical protein AAU01_21910 [Paenarthrobacter aurescens]